MDKQTVNRVARNLWGFTTVIVWICGVPTAIGYVSEGIKDAAAATSVKIFGSPPINEKQEEVLGEMSVEEWKEIQALRKANKRR